jgi:indolepyruvate ferredoxin oxidoreductase beta subunit
LALHPDALEVHGHFLKPGGKAFCNTPCPEGPTDVDATGLASQLGSPVSANLILTAFAAASGELFCTPEQLANVLERYGGNRSIVNTRAFQAGVSLNKD